MTCGSPPPCSCFILAQVFVRWEAFLSVAVLVAVPLLLRSWAKMEAEHHDTLECRTVVQTYLIAAGGCLCAVLAEVAGNAILAVLLQAIYVWYDMIGYFVILSLVLRTISKFSMCRTIENY